ncbi:hypothetical protein SAMN05421642_103403 [Rhodococcoides kyotonense]|uniref:Uncharacterized protein n=1 Tax=Rhodococcoides kyotonense TaxID=398843 RepID=A0A239FRS4_9NOCA|nr:hypothetical protein SAMN05421642_103403 [Rhodococcus kyotonensis]
MNASRATQTSRAVTAGCDRCRTKWTSANAQAVAAKHHDTYGHKTWVEQVLTIQYGDGKPETEQPALFG